MSSPWTRRALKALAWLAGAFVTWILLLNLALWTGFVSWAVSGNHRMSSLRMRHGFAWVLWPTRVHVESFALTIDAYRYQLDLQVPEGSVDIDLLALLSRRLHASAVRGDGVTAVFRYKAPPGEISDERRELYGPIDGLGTPVRRVGPPDLPPKDDAWSVHLENIDGQFSSLWVGALHFHDADVRIRGGLRARSGDLFAVDDGHVDVATAALSIDEETVCADWSGTVDLDVADYDPFSLRGKAVLERLSGTVSLDAEVVDLGPTAVFSDRPLRIRGGAGPLRIDLAVVEGEVQPDSAVDYRTPDLGVGLQKWSGDGRLHASLHGRTGGDAVLRAGVDLWGLELRRDGTKAPPITAEHISAFVVSRNRRLDAPTSLDDGRAIVEGVSVPDLSILADAVSAARPEKGSVSARYTLDVLDDGRLRHGVQAKVRGAQVVRDQTSVVVAADVDATAQTSRDLEEGESSFQIDVHDLSLDTPKGKSRRTWVKLHEASNLAWSRDGSVSGTLRGRLDDLRVVLAHISAREALVERVPDLGVTRPLDFVFDVERTAETSTVKVRQLDRPGLHLEGIRHSRGEATRSAFRLEALQVGFTSREDGAHAVFFGADDDWMDRQSTWVRRL